MRVPESLRGVRAPAGYFMSERCVAAASEAAGKAGAELYVGRRSARLDQPTATSRVRTGAGEFTAQRGSIITAGAWAGQLLAELDLNFDVRRKTLMFWSKRESADTTDAAARDVRPTCSSCRMECFMAFRQSTTLRREGGRAQRRRVVTIRSTVDRSLREPDRAPVEASCGRTLPAAKTPCTEHSRLSLHDVARRALHRRPPSRGQRIVFAAGLSGHGFKFTPCWARRWLIWRSTGRRRCRSTSCRWVLCDVNTAKLQTCLRLDTRIARIGAGG